MLCVFPHRGVRLSRARLLALLGKRAEHIDGVWFTGGIIDSGNSELFADYLDEDDRWHRYTRLFNLT